MKKSERPVGHARRLSCRGGWAARVGALLMVLAGSAISDRLVRNHLAPPATAKPKVEPAPSRSADYAEEGPFPRLQERVMSQLGFVNNLLITLAVAMLAFVGNELVDHAELRALGWRRWLLTSGLVLLALSVLVGIMVAHNRLSALRVSARTARLRQLRDRWLDQGRTFEFDRIRRQADFFSGWGRPGLTSGAESEQVRTAVTALAQALPDTLRKAPPETRRGPAGKATWRAATDLVEALRTWSDKADDRTWRWLRRQTGVFSVGALLLLIVALTISS
jgi:hypothetical protein